MRITGGSFKGRRLHPPLKKWPTRPTTDFAKEALYNILSNRIVFTEVKVLDLFSGTGSHVYEFLSRGCQDVTLVEKHRQCLHFIKSTLDLLKIEKGIVSIVGSDVFKYLDKAEDTFDIIFADPPYAMEKLSSLPDIVINKGLLSQEGLLIVEHDNTTTFANHPSLKEERTYGGCHFSFFTK